MVAYTVEAKLLEVHWSLHNPNLLDQGSSDYQTYIPPTNEINHLEKKYGKLSTLARNIN